MFRRSKSDSETAAETAQSAGRVDGKGRPTPTRKEAEAAAKARAKVPRTRKEMMAAQRLAKSESSAKVRAGMKSGEERYLLPRDKGPVRRFVRDFVDSRLSFVELLIPLLIVTMVLGYSGNATLRSIGNTILLGTVLLVIMDMFALRMRLRRQLAQRFPDEPTKGLTYYAITRALQMKFMRLPKARVKLGQPLPDDYRR
ncbi:DUF3043 domain-containing protein [Nocardioides dilutus]